jgi:dihydrofolate reductase
VGYNTSLTLPRLKNREIFIDERGVFSFNIDEIDWCIGGKKTYEKFCHLFTELHISHINDNKIGDTTFPDLKNLNPDCKIFNYYFEPNL